MVDYFIEFLAKIIAVALVISFHEFAHAFIAVKLGDFTPKAYNRLSINPINHFDLLGFLSMILIGFGWAKPVPINVNNFSDKRKGIILVSISGILMNLLFAFISYPIFLLAIRYLPDILLFDELLILTIYWIFILNLTFAIFNFIPIYPLDGFNFIFTLISSRGRIFNFLQTKGYFVLLILIGVSYLSRIVSPYIPILKIFDIFGYFMSFATNVLAKPIQWLWNLIL